MGGGGVTQFPEARDEDVVVCGWRVVGLGGAPIGQDVPRIITVITGSYDNITVDHGDTTVNHGDINIYPLTGIISLKATGTPSHTYEMETLFRLFLRLK